MGSPLSDCSVNVRIRSRVQHKLPQGIVRNGGVQPQAAASVPKLRRLYVEFLNGLCFADSTASCNPQLLDTICSCLRALCHHSLPPGIIAMSAALAEMCYRYHPFEQQVKCAHFNLLMMFVDELGWLQGEERERLLEDLTLFHHKFTNPEGYAKLYPGRGDLHPVLEDTIVFFRSEQSPFFGTDNRLHCQLLKSYFDFLDGTMLEQHYKENPLDFQSASGAGHRMTLLPSALRRKSGIAEPYVCFILMNTVASCRSKEEERFFYNKLYPLIPDMTAVLESINDVLSFYKELENGEGDNSIVIDAQVHGVSIEEALEMYAEYCVEGRRRVLAIVDNAECAEMKRKVMQFFQGYTVSCWQQTLPNERGVARWLVQR